MCVFSVSKRRRSWILGQAVSLWAGVLCNHTHKHSEDSHQRSRAGVQRRRNSPPYKYTHPHTLPSLPLRPTHVGVSPLRTAGRRCCDCQGQPFMLQIRETGPQLISRSHCQCCFPRRPSWLPYLQSSTRHIGTTLPMT